ncbi:serine threonine- phosphatase 6 regulatory subunit 3-like [Olea europaea subsp. europaea]|uniref:Serine threonine- phosphatase 6 regulatory subunit 3-like n=1 Tax=Olea europaea subsp. europaea TaxID=158383 RepID=A0A8S0U4R3_OLEEU|nr:serine threonine- phosphatase 6 regulatory subunit 3-like [Olea europaea subsp. europaea]
MFWPLARISTTFPVETILDKENFTLEELLAEDEIIQECKAINGRLINFLQERTQVEQLVRYIVEEAPEDAEKQRNFKFPFVACEIFTCEVDIILKALVEDEEIMNLLFSFLDPERPHSTSLAGYFSKVVVCLLLLKTIPLMNYIRDHQDIIRKLIDLIRITSIMEVLIRLIGADEHIYTNDLDSIPWLEDMNVLEMIVDKFSSSDCPGVHANAAETLCAIVLCAPPGLASKISSPSFIGRLFHHALEESRPKSVLVNLLSVCISLLDPKKLMSGTYYLYHHQMTNGSGISVKPETVEGMLVSLGNILKLLDFSSEDMVLLTTYGKLQPPLGKHRLKQNSEWADWYSNVLLKRNAVENVFQWACGRPTTLHDRTRDSDDDDYQYRDYDVATLANNLSQVFRYGVSNNDDIDEVHGSLERDYEDVYFDDESAEEVISSLRFGDEQDRQTIQIPSGFGLILSASLSSLCLLADYPLVARHVSPYEDLADTATSELPELKPSLANPAPNNLSENSTETETETTVSERPPEWVEWRVDSDLGELSDPTLTPNSPVCELHVESDIRPDNAGSDKADASQSSVTASVENCKSDAGGESTYLLNIDFEANISQPAEAGEGISSTENVNSLASTGGSAGHVTESKEKN